MRKKTSSIVLGIILLLFALVAIMPFVIMALMSLTQKTVFNLKFDFSEFSLKNYYVVFQNMNIGRYLFNSVVVVLGACALTCLVSCLAGYGFAKKRFPGREKIFFIYLATLMIPGQATLIPIFLMMKEMGLMNTHLALMLPFANAFGVFLVRQFMVNLPDELLEAARVDGCKEYQLFIRIVMPLVKPVVVSLTIFTFVSCWNDYLWPLVMTTEDSMRTLTLAVATLSTQNIVNYGLVMTGTTVAFLPPFILYLLLQKQFVEGIALSGTKM